MKRQIFVAISSAVVHSLDYSNRENMFKKNIDTSGRMLRLAIAVILLIYAIWQHSWIALLFSLFTFFESLMSWCIVYQLLGKSSFPVDKRDSPK